MNACLTLANPEITNRGQLPETPGIEPRKTWNAGLRLDAAANLAVLCAGVALVLLAVATDGQFVLPMLTA